MRTRPEQLLRYWRYFSEIRCLTESEIVEGFVDGLDPTRIEEEWSTLPEGYREVIVRYFQKNSPEEMPPICIIGRPTEEHLARMNEELRRNAEGLVSYLRGLQVAPPIGGWFEVWAEDRSPDPPYLLIVRPEPDQLCRLQVLDPQEADRMVFGSEDYEVVRQWLWEDEFEMVRGRERR